MNTNDELVAAPRERLVEVLLEEMSRATRAHARTDASPRARSYWLAAAIALLGVGVVVGTIVLRTHEQSQVAPAQDPQSAPTEQWMKDAVPVATREQWLALVPQVRRVRLRLLRPTSNGAFEPFDQAVAVLDDVQRVHDFVAGVPMPSGIGTEHPGPVFDTLLTFELQDGRRVNAFLRLSSNVAMVLGVARVGTIDDAFVKAVQALALEASRNEGIARGVVQSLTELERVPETAKAIRCPPMPNGTLAKYLGRFAQLEHLEFVITVNLVASGPIEIPVAGSPSTLFEEMKVLPKLRHLRVMSGMLTDERAAELARLNTLVSLRIDGFLSVRDAGIVGRKVDARGGITAAGMRTLAKKIEALELVDANPAPELLEPWLEAAQLRKLVIFGDAIAPELLARFARLPTLRELGLGDIAWTDKHLQALAGSRIEVLRLEHTDATIAGLRQLPRSLRLLDLRKQEFDESGWRPIEIGLPECRVLRAGDTDASDSDPFAGIAGATRR